MPHSFVGKTLRGNFTIAYRTAVLLLNKSGQEIRDNDSFSCLDQNLDLKFISMICDKDTKCSGKIAFQAQLFVFNNNISCIATVDDNKNIEIIAYGKYDIKINENQREDILSDLRFIFKKCDDKYKYKISGEGTFNDVINNLDGSTTEFYFTTKIIKSKTFRFVRYL